MDRHNQERGVVVTGSRAHGILDECASRRRWREDFMRGEAKSPREGAAGWDLGLCRLELFVPGGIEREMETMVEIQAGAQIARL